MRWHLSGEPFLTPIGPLVNGVTAAVETVIGVRPELSTGGGTSDGRFIAPYGTHIVEFGAVNSSIHKIDEHVAVPDIEAMKNVYCTILARMLLGGT